MRGRGGTRDLILLTLAVARFSLPSSATSSTTTSNPCGPSSSPPPPPISTYSPRERLVALCRGDDGQRGGRPRLELEQWQGGDAWPGTSSLVGGPSIWVCCRAGAYHRGECTKNLSGYLSGPLPGSRIGASIWLLEAVRIESRESLCQKRAGNGHFWHIFFYSSEYNHKFWAG